MDITGQRAKSKLSASYLRPAFAAQQKRRRNLSAEVARQSRHMQAATVFGGRSVPAKSVGGRIVATCDKCWRMAHWGFGRMWACAAHRDEIEAEWVAKGSKPK